MTKGFEAREYKGTPMQQGNMTNFRVEMYSGAMLAKADPVKDRTRVGSLSPPDKCLRHTTDSATGNPVVTAVVPCYLGNRKTDFVWGIMGVDQITEKYYLHDHIYALDTSAVESKNLMSDT